MKLIFKVVVCFVVVALLMLAVLMYLEQKDGLNTSPTSVWEDIKSAGGRVVSYIGGFLNKDKIRESAAEVLEESAAKLKGMSDEPDQDNSQDPQAQADDENAEPDRDD